MPDYALINQKVYEGKAKEVKQLIEEALQEGSLTQDVLSKGLIAAMDVIGQDFKHNILYVPEVLIAARAMKAGLSVLKPLLSQNKEVSRGTLLIGTVKGDLHDIGKNLVCMMAEGSGFNIIDIGVDQSIEQFKEAARTHLPEIIGMSALLTTTMPYMAKVIDSFAQDNELKQIKFAVGGAPVTKEFAQEIGAAGHGADASSSVELFTNLLEHNGIVTNDF